jgi:hypothetical protein
LQINELFAHTSQQYPRQCYPEVARWAIINWLIYDTFLTQYHIDIVTTASQRHWLHRPPPTFTTSDVQGAFDTSTARRSGNMWMRHCFCKHFACWFYLTLLALFFRLSWLHPSHQPPILSTIPRCSNHIARRCGNTKVRNDLQYYLQHLSNRKLLDGMD